MKKYNYCIWSGKRVQPSATTCYWLFGTQPECSAYRQGTFEGRCMYLTEITGSEEDD